MREPSDKELKPIHDIRTEIGDMEASLKFLVAKFENEIHQLKKKCGVPFSAILNQEDLSHWVTVVGRQPNGDFTTKRVIQDAIS